jgi:hypothetical protein
LITVSLPTAAVYLALSGAGLYLLIKDRTIPAVAFILAANVVLFAFHRWAGRQDREDGPRLPQG